MNQHKELHRAVNIPAIWGAVSLLPVQGIFYWAEYLLLCKHSSHFCDQTHSMFTVSKTNICVMRWRVCGIFVSRYLSPKQDGKPHN